MMKHIAILLLALTPLPLVQPALALDRLITVTGESTISAAPDMAQLQLGVTTQAQSAREASDANAKKMTALFAVIKAAGIAEADVQTVALSLQPMMGGGNSPRITSFQATNQLIIKVRDLSALSALLDRTVAAGANDVSGIEFVVSDRNKMLDRARKAAIEDARHKAELYATTAGAKLGPVVSISEGGRPVMRPMSGVATMRDAASIPVAPGEQNLQHSVNVVYELTQ